MKATNHAEETLNCNTFVSEEQSQPLMFHVEFAEDKVVLIRKLFLFNSTSSNIFHLILPVKNKENKEFPLYVCFVLLLQGLICSNFDVGENK